MMIMSTPDPRDTLAANINAIIDHESRNGERLSLRAWALSKGLNVRMIDRLSKKQHAITLDKLDALARACNLQAWQLLVPDLDPASPPAAEITAEDRAMLNKLRSLLAKP